MKIKREIFLKLQNEISRPFISILIGPRQVGKSFLLSEIEKECKRSGLKTMFFNLEFPEDLRAFTGSEEEIIKVIRDSGDVVFIDEFHYLKNATKILKVIYDSSNKQKIFVSGSSSIEIHKHLKESLAGRYRLTNVFPLYLKELQKQKNYKSSDYFVMGGMPGLVHEKLFDDQIELLNNIVQTYLMKDVKGLIKEENIRAFNQLLYLLAHNQGSVTSVASLAREIHLTEPAVKHHLELLEQTFVAYSLSSYSKNLANELKKIKKYYLFDLGIRNSLLSDFSHLDRRDDRGVIIESFVFLSIIKQLKPNMEVKFWRTRQGDEVDFILLKNRIPYPVEVKFKIKSPNIPNGMKRFLEKYPDAPGGIVVSRNMEEEIKFDDRVIKFIKLEDVEKMDYLSNE